MERVEQLISRYVDGGRFPGVVSLVSHRDQVVHFQTVGRRGAERDLSRCPATRRVNPPDG